MYKKHPKRMLSARCKSYLARDVYPQLLMGLLTDDEAHEVAQREPQRVSVELVTPVAPGETVLSESEYNFIASAIEEAHSDELLRKIGASIANTPMSAEQKKTLRAAYAKRKNKIAKHAREAQAATTSAEADAPPDNDAAEIEGEVHHAQFDE
jgi:hypothetical protein